MRFLNFKNGEFAIYDDEFEDLVKSYKWYLRKIVTKTGIETVRIMIHPSKKTKLGTYKSAWEAAESYNKKVIEVYGNHAYQNVKNESTKKKEETNI